MSKQKKFVILGIVFIILILCFLFSVIFSVLNMNNSNIFSGITINDIDVSNMSKEEAISKLTEMANKKTNEEIKLLYNDEDIETTLELSMLDIKYDIVSAVEEAYSYGRTENIFKNNFKILDALLNKKNIQINISMDDDNLSATIEKIASNLPNKIVQNNYYIEDDNLIITRGSEGVSINTENFRNKINEIVVNISSLDNEINIPTIYESPGKIDIDKIHKEIYKEPKDAYYEEEPFKVYTEVKGVDFDVEKAKKAINKNKEQKEYTIQLVYKEPKTKLKDLDVDIFRDLLGNFSTQYDVRNKERSTNLQLAAEKINETIIAPGEEFSYNKIVGARTIEAGYKEAKVYSNGQVVDGIGGGICQISSTLYNAVVFANLKVTERYNHQFITSYVDAGRDATVAYGSKDFKFINNRTYPIKILMTVSSGIVKVEIYGIKEENECEVSFDIETISNIPYKTTYKESSSIEEGTEVVKQVGANGIIVNAYKIIKQKGVTISRELISKDKYNALEKIVIKGTKTKVQDNIEENE